MNTRYIAIEHNSGYIWGDVTAETPEAACSAIAHEADRTLPWTEWEWVSPITDTSGGFHLYVAPAGFPVIDDGADQGLIERVEAECTHVGDYASMPDADDDE